MTVKESYHGWITLLNIFLIFGTVAPADEETVSENLRNERAILGLFSANDIVGGGSPGRDFPTLSVVPRTDFSCRHRTPGYYADEEYGCQVFHVCHADFRKDSFLCPNGTIFHQLRLVCDWWYNVDCSTSNLHVSVNNDIGKFTPRQKAHRVSITNDDINRSPLFRGSSREDFGGRPFDSHSDFGLNDLRNDIVTTIRPSIDAIRESFGIPLQTISNVGNNRFDNDFRSTRTEKPQHDRIRESFGVPLQGISNVGSNRFDNDFRSTRTEKPQRDRIRESFGITLQDISNVGSNRFDNDFRTTARTERPQSLNDLQFPPALQTPFQTFSSSPPNTTPIPFFTRKIETTRSTFGVPLRTTNVTPRTSFRTSLSRDFSPPPQVNRILSSAAPKFGVNLPLHTNDLSDFRDDSFVLFDDRKAFVSTGVPLPPPTSPPQNLHDAIVPPEHFTVPKPKPPSRVSTNQNSFGVRGTTERISNARRVKVNKRPITTSVQREPQRNDQHLSSLFPGRPQVHFNRISLLDNDDDDDDDDQVVILDDDEIATQFFNLGSPRRVANRRPFSTPVGRPLPSLEIKTNNGRRVDAFKQPIQSGKVNKNQNDILRTSIGIPLPPQIDIQRNSIGVPLPRQHDVQRISTGIPLPPPKDIQRNSIGVPLPSISTTSNVNRNQLSNKEGISLSEANQRSRNHFRTNIGRPLPTFNRITSGKNNAIGSSFRLSSSREFGHNNQRSRENVNRGSATFLNSQRNRASIQNLLNNQVGRTAATGSQSSSGFTVKLDDDDLDDLNDPFDDDRFDDDRFDLDDRFDDDRFDGDRFDDDRFDLDDKFDLDDRFDDDRFDLDDRFDDDRFDDDRFELDDRFDNDRHDDDRFDKDLFDFDDEFDDRRRKFGNSAGFNFGRRARGSVFSSQTADKTDTTKHNNENVKSEGNENIVAIEPPSEIQLPPPPL